MLTIEWFGHSCFRISTAEYKIVLDPYKPGMVPGLGNYSLDADMVLASHEHQDHNYKEVVKLNSASNPNPFKIEYIESFHDSKSGKERGMNKITLITYGDIRIAHLGDLGTILSKEQCSMLENLDAIMIPVGGYYTINAIEAKKICEAINPKVIIPMHFRTNNFGFPVIAKLEEFTKLFPKKSLLKYKENKINIDKNTQYQIALLKYR